MEVGVICFNLARLTGVVYCGSLLPLMASNSSNGTHLLSFHPPSLHWWGWQNMEEKNIYIYLLVWNGGDAPLSSFEEVCCAVCIWMCVHMHVLYVCMSTSGGLCAHFCTIRDGVTKSWRCLVSVCKLDYWEIMGMCMCVCVCDWMERTQAVAEPQQSTNRSRPLFVLSLAIDWGNQTSERKREVLIIMLYSVKPTWPCLLDYAVWLMTAAAGAVSQAF